MTHASLELVWCIAGVFPDNYDQMLLWKKHQCGNYQKWDRTVGGFTTDNNEWPSSVAVDCPECLVAIDAAHEGVILPSPS